MFSFRLLPLSVLLLVFQPLLAANTLKPSFPSSSCICDITTACDYLCCCDSDCPASTVSLWKLSNSCTPSNNNGLAINLCSNLKPMQISDLYSGLRMIYEVIKRLFCLQSVNYVDGEKMGYRVKVGREDGKGVMDSYKTKVEANTVSASYVNPYSSFAISYTYNSNPIELPSVSGSSYCQWSSSHLNITTQPQPCKSNLLSTNTNALFHTLSVYTTKYPSFTPTIYTSNGNSTTTATSTTCTTSSSPWSCTNIVKQVKYKIRLNADTGDFETMEIDIVVGDLTNYYYNIVEIMVGLEYTTGTGESYQRAGNLGYEYLSPLVVQYNNVMTKSPFNIGFKDSSNLCVENNTSGNSTWSIRFGQDFGAFCVIQNNNTAQILTNINQIFQTIGKIGGANPEYSKDFTTSSSSLNQSGILSIYYSKIGMRSENHQYQIESAGWSNLGASNGSLFSVFIEWKEIEVGTAVYVAPPPTAQVRLDNDVLYPFHMY